MTETVPVRLRTGVQPTPMQRGLMASQRRHPTQPLQNMALVSHLDGPVDAERLADAFDAVVAAHDVLRTRVTDTDGHLAVEIAADGSRTEIVDLARSATRGWAAVRAGRVIDLATSAYDSVIVRHPDGTASWYLALHHAVTDATSSLLVFDATASVYHGGEAPGSDYYGWWAGRTDDRRTAAARRHWEHRGEAARTGQLYRQVVRPTPASHRTSVTFDDDLRRLVEQRLGDDLAAMSDELGWTTLLVTVAALYLHRLTGADEMAIGLPVHGRTDAETRALVGPLMEVFPVDVAIEPDDTFRSLHRRVGRSVMATLRHARLGTAPPGNDVEAVVNVITRAGHGAFGTIPATTEWIHPGASDPSHLFRLQLTTYGDDVDLLLDLNDAAADEDHRRRAPGHVTQILGALVADPDRPVRSGTVCDDDEVAMLRAWGIGPEPEPTTPSIVPLLADALAGVDSVVIEQGDVRLTGDELWRRATAVAGWLRQHGVGSETGRGRVAIELDRSVDAVVAILATLLAGGSYVPLDPSQPADRRRRLAERAGCAVVLDALPAADPTAAPFELPTIAADDEAYLLFTSGSTGEPKGVPISHGGLSAYAGFALDAYVEPGVDVVAPLFSALTFDLTVTSLFVPLLAGGRLVVVGPSGPTGLAEIANRSDLTWCKATPSHLEVLLRLDPACDLRTLVVGGEAFPARLGRQLHRTFPRVRLFNEYGPTEAVVGCMIHEATTENLVDAVDVPIGVPAPGVELRVVDRDLQDVPIGAPGELLISHAGLTVGYLDGTDADDPFVRLDGRRWYRSGDLVRLNDPETLVYHGRIDEQIKTGGIRLEPVEVEHALAAHPAIDRAAVRLWSPRPTAPERHCVRCGLPSNIPGIDVDDDGVCDTCHDYERIRHQAEAYFRTIDDLIAIRDRARSARTGPYDCLHLLSGGKDSTYALYRLVELGFSVRTMTLDNGFISEGAKDNVRRSVAELGVDHEFVTSDAMNEIFRDSLARHSNVCHGCYKTMYTLATTRADELGIPVVVTGLSRGQLFETRLVPQQFGRERFDPDAIDRAVIEARRSYHRIDDGTNRLLDTSVFDADDVFDRISYVDFYRYVDVELAEMYEFLDRSAPWVRPADTGRSTNCLINAAGIHTHLTEQGYHNYAVPYAWDVRLGHKTRQEAIDELDDDLDLDAVADMLGDVGYEPSPRHVLTAWFQLAADAAAPSPAELRAFLAERLPAYAIPSGFVAVDEIPMTTNGKLDADRLPPPTRVHRSGPSLEVPSETELEAEIVALYERVLQLEPVGVTDDFFDLGGDSLAALSLAVAASERLGRTIREELVFVNTTPRALAAAIAVASDAPAETAAREVPPAPAITRPAGEPPATSAAEQAMLFEFLDDPSDPRFNVGHRFRIRGELDTDRFVAAFRSVVARQPTLHWTYSEPRRSLSADDAIDVLVRTGPVDDAELDAALRRFHVTPLDLEHGPLGRCVVQPMTDGSVAVLIVVHHIAIDAGSFELLWTQVDRAYRDGELAPLGLDYADHAAWQEQRLAEAGLGSFLDAMPAPIDLGGRGSDRPAGSARGRTGGYLQRTAAFTTAELRAGPGTTPYATVLGALATVLRPRCPTGSVPVGLTVSSREHPAASETIGLFLNTSPAVVEVPDDATHATVAASASEAVAGALAARAIPLARIAAARRRAGLTPPPVDVLLALEDWAPCVLGTYDVDHDVLATESPVADATFFVQLHGERVVLSVEHRTDVVDGPEAARLLDRFEDAIATAIERPLAAVTPRTVTSDAAGPVTGPAIVPDDRLLHHVIEEQAGRDPAAPAVRWDDTVLSYGDLVSRANRIAHALRAAGVGNGDAVGVVAARRPETVVAIVGVLKAGAAYVAIDPGHPGERIDQIVADADIRVVVASTSSDVPVTLPDSVVRLSLDAADLDRFPDTAPEVAATPDDLAYLIYTSGSTGTPKGVMVRHRNIVASTRAREVVYPRAPERFLLLSSFAFDSSMVGLFWTLCSGATIELPADGAHDDVLEIAALVERRQITHLLALPSLYRLVLVEADPGRLASLDTVVVAGEACPYDVVALHRASCPSAMLVNEYGPTEATVWSHAFHVDDSVASDPVPIGTPIPGVAQLVLDTAGRPVPDGDPGELYIGGAGVAAGYHGRPDLTAERFVELEPRLAGDVAGPWYRTGDLVRSDPVGRLVFEGRADDQIKVRGVRVEPGEVEVALRACDGVADAVVGLTTSGSGRDVLTAWLVPDDHDAPAAGDLRAELAVHLPDQMVPARFVHVDALPLNANGKVDRRALAASAPAPEARPDGPAVRDAVDGGIGTDPDAREGALASIWADVLGVPTVEPDDNFFDLGGDSIMSLQIVARARRLGIELRPRHVFEHQTVSELAAVASGATTAVERPDTTGDVPLTPIQHWFLLLGLAEPDHWNQTITLDLESTVDVGALLGALDDVRRRHEQLRCRFVLSDGAWRQTIVDDPAPTLVRSIDLGEPGADEAAELGAVEGGLDLASAQTVGALVVGEGGVPRRIVVTVHHLVVDGVSWSTIVEDWAVAYGGRMAGTAPRFATRSSSFRRWADELAAAAATGRFETSGAQWQPDGDPSVAADLALAGDTSNTEAAARRVTRRLDRQVTSRLIGATGGGAGAVSVEEVVLTAAALVIPGRIGRDRLDVVLEGHGREHFGVDDLDPSRTVGWFTTQSPVDLRVDGSDPGEALAAVTARVRAIPDRGLGFGAERHLRGGGRPPGDLPVIAFNYLGQLDRTVRPQTPFVAARDLRSSIAPENRRGHLLGILAAVTDGQLTVEVDHHPAHIDAAAADELVSALCDAIESVVATTASNRPTFDLLDQSPADAAQLGALLDRLD